MHNMQIQSDYMMQKHILLWYQQLKQHRENIHEGMTTKFLTGKESASQKTKHNYTFASATPYDTFSQRQREISDSTIVYLAINIVHMYTFNKVGFQKTIHLLDKREQHLCAF